MSKPWKDQRGQVRYYRAPVNDMGGYKTLTCRKQRNKRGELDDGWTVHAFDGMLGWVHEKRTVQNGKRYLCNRSAKGLQKGEIPYAIGEILQEAAA